MSIQEYNEQIENLFTEIKLLVDEIYEGEETAWLKNAKPQENGKKTAKNINKK